MIFKTLSIFCFLLATSQAGLLLGKDGLLHKAANKIGISNLVNVDADARVNVLGNQVGIDGAVGIGESGIGAHASADADVLGQKAKVHADILDGHKIDQHNHEVFRDSANRQYVLQRQYIGSQSVLVRKYLDNGQIYLDGANDDNVLQHKQGGQSRWNGDFGDRYYPVHPSHQNEVVGGWQKDGSYIAVDPVHPSHQNEVVGGWQKDGSYIAVDPVHPSHQNEVVGGWQKDGSYIAVDPVHPSHQNEVNGGWQKDGSYIAVDPVHPSQQNEVNGSWEEDDSYIAVDPVHPSQREEYLTSVPKRRRSQTSF